MGEVLDMVGCLVKGIAWVVKEQVSGIERKDVEKFASKLAAQGKHAADRFEERHGDSMTEEQRERFERYR